MFRKLKYSPWLLLAVLALTIAVYWPGLQGGFLFDDRVNITDNPYLTQATEWAWRPLKIAANSYGSFPFKRPLSMLTLAANHVAAGLDPWGYKLVNLAVHLATGVGIYWLTRLLLAPAGGGCARVRRAGSAESPVGNASAVESAFTVRGGDAIGIFAIGTVENERRRLVALAVAAAWLLHPFNLTSVLYVVQRMNSLSALFCVLGMIAYALGRLRQFQGRSGAGLMMIGLFGCGALAFLSKENGALLPVFLLVMEALLFRFQAATVPARRFVQGFHALFTIGPLVLAAVFLMVKPDWLIGGYASRDFTLGERLLTEARVLWFYIRCILLPATDRMALYHDDIVLSHGVFDPPSTLPAVLGLAALAGFALTLRTRAPVLAFGVLFYFAGHVMESGVFALELAHEHRNYLPAYGLLLPVFFYLLRPDPTLPLMRRAGPLVAGALILVFAGGTVLRASAWGNDLERAVLDVRHHPESARSRIELGYAYSILAEQSTNPTQYRDAAREQFLAAARYGQYSLTGQFGILVLDSKDGKPADPALVSELSARLAQPPLSPASTNALIQLSQCRLAGHCPLAPEVLWRLFDGILRNPLLGGKARAQVLTELVQQKLAEGDGDGVLSYAEDAVRHDPNSPQGHLNFANLLIAAKDAAGARAQIDRARALDRDGFYQGRIAAQEKLLADLSGAR